MYVVLGSTGHTGSVVANAVLAKKEPLRVVVRSSEKGASWKARGADVALADVEDAAALTAAFKGATGVYVLVPPDFRTTEVHARSKRIVDAVAAAVAASKVPHVVLLSSVGAHQPEGTGIIRSLHYAEQRLAETGTSLSAVRAGYFLENFGGLVPVAKQNGVLPSGITIDKKVPMVASKDVGGAAATALLEGVRGKRDIIELAGPEDLSPTDIAAKLATVLSKPVQPLQIGSQDLKQAFLGMGASEDIANNYVEMVAGFNAGRVAFEGKGARLLRGPTRAEEVLATLQGGH
jgi:uncharacterized protein YbjT (DUF2867 family)